MHNQTYKRHVSSARASLTYYRESQEAAKIAAESINDDYQNHPDLEKTTRSFLNQNVAYAIRCTHL